MDDSSAAAKAAFRAIYTAMLAGDTTALGALLARDFTLTHMTGRVQTRDEWLADIDAARMTYHAQQEVSVRVDINGNSATLTGRNHTDATIYGARATWPLQLTTHLERHNGRWIAKRMVAATF